MASWHKLSYLHPNSLRRFQDCRLHCLVKYQLPYSPFYRNCFKANNLSFSSIKTLEGLKKLPVISKEDIAPTKENPKKFMDFVLQPTQELIKKYLPKYRFLNPSLKQALEWEYKPIHPHFTTGRSAVSTPFLNTAYDMEKLNEAGRRMMEIANISSESKGISTFPYAPHLAFWQAYYAFIASGIFALNTGGGKVMGTDRILSSMQSMQPNIMIGMPGYVFHLFNAASEKKIRLPSLNKIILGAERVPEGLKEKLKAVGKSIGISDLEVLSTYAFTEGKVAWIQCNEHSSYHLYPDMEYIEILDNNNEQVSDGEKGNIVYTALDFRGTVVLRYKTGDIGRKEEGSCPHCRRTVPRIGLDIERSSEFREFNLTKVKGTLVNLNEFFPLLMAEKNIDEWQLEISKKGHKKYGLDEMTLYIALKSRKSTEGYKQIIANKIESITEVRPKIFILERKKLLQRLGMETELKENRIVDLR